MYWQLPESSFLLSLGTRRLTCFSVCTPPASEIAAIGLGSLLAYASMCESVCRAA